MPRQCLFCEKTANSREHLWPDWILQRQAWGPVQMTIGKSPRKVIAGPNQKVRSVCNQCNNGWMSELEGRNRPLIGCLMQDFSMPLDASQQESLALWTVKTAMVLDSINKRDRSSFYERADCENLRQHLTIPPKTTVWAGRYYRSGLAAFGTDLWLCLPDGPRGARACATTIIVGHLALQTLTIYRLPGYEQTSLSADSKVGQWTGLLIEVWPARTRPVDWPPPLTFTNSGGGSIATLMDRWKIGKAV